MRHPQISVEGLVSECGDAEEHLHPLYKDRCLPGCPPLKSTTGCNWHFFIYYDLLTSTQIFGNSFAQSPPVTYILCFPKQPYPNKLTFWRYVHSECVQVQWSSPSKLVCLFVQDLVRLKKTKNKQKNTLTS